MAKQPTQSEKLSEEEKLARREAKRAILETEDAKSRFRRLANARLNNALDVIALIGNLSGQNYDYSETQVEAIRQSLIDGVNKAMNRFKPKSKEDRERVEIPED